jgi:hypothetical protein
VPRNISDQEYEYLQGRRQVADFVESIYNDPALSKDAKRLIKRKYPQMQIPDLDIEDRIEARFQEEKKLRDETEAKARETADREAWQAKRGKTQQEYGLTDEGMVDLEKFMVERNIGDYDVAASYRHQREPKVSSDNGGFGNGLWEHEKQAGFQDIAKDPEGWGRNEIMKAIRADQERERGR